MIPIENKAIVNVNGTDEENLILLNKLLNKMIANEKLPDMDLSKIKNGHLREVFETLNILSDNLDELRNYMNSLAEGNIDAEPPSRQNYISGGLKELQSNLLHMTWKVDQISKGDYNQEIDFMGRFSDSFNDMVTKLRARESEISEARQVVEALSAYADIVLFVTDAKTGKLIYCKSKLDEIEWKESCRLDLKVFVNKLHEKVSSEKLPSYEWEVYSDIELKWYWAKSMIMSWTNNESVYLHMLLDISDQKEILKDLEDKINRDIRTGIYNYPFAKNKIKELIEARSNFTIVFMDLDGLKDVNDSFGHLEGDKLINNFVKLVLSQIRSEDFFCRIGGDEFLIISPYSTEKVLEKVINRIRTKINDFNNKSKSPYSVAFSHGIEEYIAQRESCSVNELIDCADKKMYSNKLQKKHRP
ncbi:GGDEF domain-containing protein [Anaeropeptidivorans aminofermentans]|uniref:GGDEF domain-containing protein n=1 Tax=Anaeropeptidivorans aminofermentans TaxID=2934315 RepID=UPI002024A774|nr:GGDEF domain-containing protein [Anaeropeptidivorans aminofermentans]